VFQVTVGGDTNIYDLSDHNPLTLDVNGQSWSVAVERAGQGWVTVAAGPAITCGGSETTTTTEAPSPPPDGCDDVECPPDGPPVPPDNPPTTTTTPDEAPTTTVPGQPDPDGNCADWQHNIGTVADPVCVADEESG
jgi:hypothetical protein